MKFVLLFGVPVLALINSALFLLLAFGVISLGADDPMYGDMLAWISMTVTSIVISIVVVYGWPCFKALRVYPLIVWTGVILAYFDIHTLSLVKIYCALAIATSLSELYIRLIASSSATTSSR